MVSEVRLDPQEKMELRDPLDLLARPVLLVHLVLLEQPDPWDLLDLQELLQRRPRHRLQQPRALLLTQLMYQHPNRLKH